MFIAVILDTSVPDEWCQEFNFLKLVEYRNNYKKINIIEKLHKKKRRKGIPPSTRG